MPRDDRRLSRVAVLIRKGEPVGVAAAMRGPALLRIRGQDRVLLGELLIRVPDAQSRASCLVPCGMTTSATGWSVQPLGT